MSPQAIRIENLSKSYGWRPALQDLSLDVDEGQVFAFVGPNGAGKTTTIKILMNIIEASKGSSMIFGVESCRLSAKDLQVVGYVSENQELPGWMTVAQFLNFCSQLYPGWDADFCRQLTTQFNIPLGDRLKKLSRGLRMKVALISSIAYHPRLLILDEPFANLDPLARMEFSSILMERNSGKSRTIFISSHDLDEVERFATHIGFLNAGRLKISSDIPSLLQRFRKVRVQGDIKDTVTWPAGWMLGGQESGVCELVIPDFQEYETDRLIKELAGDVVGPYELMNLKEIFIYFAKSDKL